MRCAEEETVCVPTPCFALCAGPKQVYGAGSRRGFCVDAESGKELFDFSVPPGVCEMCLFGGRLLALSSEADCLCAFDRERGQLLFSAPAGVFPRAMCLSTGGQYVAVAGGAAGEVLFFDQALHCVQRKKAAGIPCALCFLERHLAVLCAVEDREAVASRLMLFSPRGVEEEIFFSPQMPCALCALPGGRCLVGREGGVVGLSSDHRAVFCCPCVCPTRIRLTRMGPLIVDAAAGSIRPLFRKPLVEAGDCCDVCVTK